MTSREHEAVEVAADVLLGAGDPVAMVTALVRELVKRDKLPDTEVAVMLKELIEEHPEAAKLVRIEYLNAATFTQVRDIFSGWQGHMQSLQPMREGWRVMSVIHPWPTEYLVREEAEAALTAGQPVLGRLRLPVRRRVTYVVWRSRERRIVGASTSPSSVPTRLRLQRQHPWNVPDRGVTATGACS